MGIVRKVVIGSLALGAAKLAMRNKKFSRATEDLAVKVRKAVGLKAIHKVVSEAAGSGKRTARRALRKVSSSKAGKRA